MGWAAKVAVFLGLVFCAKLRIHDVFSLSLWMNCYGLPTFDKVVLVTGNVIFYFGDSIENDLTLGSFCLSCRVILMCLGGCDVIRLAPSLSCHLFVCVRGHDLVSLSPTILVSVGCCRMTATVRRHHNMTCQAAVTPTSPSQRQVRTSPFSMIHQQGLLFIVTCIKKHIFF